MSTQNSTQTAQLQFWQRHLQILQCYQRGQKCSQAGWQCKCLHHLPFVTGTSPQLSQLPAWCTAIWMNTCINPTLHSRKQFLSNCFSVPILDPFFLLNFPQPSSSSSKASSSVWDMMMASKVSRCKRSNRQELCATAEHLCGVLPNKHSAPM